MAGRSVTSSIKNQQSAIINQIDWHAPVWNCDHRPAQPTRRATLSPSDACLPAGVFTCHILLGSPTHEVFNAIW